MKRKQRRETVGRKKVIVVLWGINTIRYKSEVVVDVPEDATKTEIVDSIKQYFYSMPEPDWQEFDEDGLCLDDQDDPDVQGSAAADSTPALTLHRSDDGELVAAPQG